MNDDHTSLPGVMQLSHGLLLQGPVLLHLQHLVSIGVREVTRRDGVHPDRYRLLLSLLAAAADDYRAVSPVGHEDVPRSSPAAESSSSELLTTREAAAVVGLSERQVRRLAPELSGGATGSSRVLMFDRVAVEAFAASRTDQRLARVTVEVSTMNVLTLDNLDGPTARAVRSSQAYQNWPGMPARPAVSAELAAAARQAVAPMTADQRAALRSELGRRR